MGEASRRLRYKDGCISLSKVNGSPTQSLLLAFMLQRDLRRRLRADIEAVCLSGSGFKLVKLVEPNVPRAALKGMPSDDIKRLANEPSCMLMVCERQ